MDPLDKIAELLKTYYNPFKMIEHKYRTKITAIGLLKNSLFNTAEYIEPYYHRLAGYKGLIRDHTDNMKLAAQIAHSIFRENIQALLDSQNRPSINESGLLDLFIGLVYPRFDNAAAPERETFRRQFVGKYSTGDAASSLAMYVMKNHLDTSDKYDRLADAIVKRCLTGITQKDVSDRIDTAELNYFVYGIYSRAEVTNIYNISVRIGAEVRQLKYFTKIAVLARSVINQAEGRKTTVNFFGQLWETFEEVKKMFVKNQNITIMFY